VLRPDSQRHDIYHDDRDGAFLGAAKDLQYKEGPLEVAIGCMILEVVFLVNLYSTISE
jgi:hypothetical protein